MFLFSLTTHCYLIVAEAMSQDQSEQRVHDVGCAQQSLEPTDSAHHTEQNHIPLDHILGLHTDAGPQRSVIQVPWTGTETRETSAGWEDGLVGPCVCVCMFLTSLGQILVGRPMLDLRWCCTDREDLERDQWNWPCSRWQQPADTDRSAPPHTTSGNDKHL